MKKIIIENDKVTVYFDLHQNGLYFPFIEYEGNFEDINLFLSKEEVLQIIWEFDEKVHLKDQTSIEMIKMIITGYFRMKMQESGRK